MENKEKKQNISTNVYVLIISIALITMSALMLFVEGLKIIFLCYTLCAVAIIAGICMIVRYFITDAYRNVNAYGFSLGTFFVMLGICGMLKASQMSDIFIIILGIILLLSGVIALQHTLDLRRMEDKVWIPALVVALIILICSIVIILQPFSSKINYDLFVWWFTLVSEILALILNLYTLIRVNAIIKKEKEQIAEEQSVSEDNNTKKEETVHESEPEKKSEEKHVEEEKTDNGNV